MFAGYYKGYKYPVGTHWTQEVKKIQKYANVSWNVAKKMRDDLKKLEVSKPSKTAKKKTSVKKTVDNTKNIIDVAEPVNKTEKIKKTRAVSKSGNKKLEEKIERAKKRIIQLRNEYYKLYSSGPSRRTTKMKTDRLAKITEMERDFRFFLKDNGVITKGSVLNPELTEFEDFAKKKFIINPEDIKGMRMVSRNW